MWWKAARVLRECKWVHDQEKSYVEKNTGGTQAMGYNWEYLQCRLGWERRRKSVTPETPSTNKAMAKAIISMDQGSWIRAWPGTAPPGHGYLRIHLKVIQETCPRNENSSQDDNHGVAFHCLDSLQCWAVAVVTKLVFCPPPATKAQSERVPLFHHSQRSFLTALCLWLNTNCILYPSTWPF